MQVSNSDGGLVGCEMKTLPSFHLQNLNTVLPDHSIVVLCRRIVPGKKKD